MAIISKISTRVRTYQKVHVYVQYLKNNLKYKHSGAQVGVVSIEGITVYYSTYTCTVPYPWYSTRVPFWYVHVYHGTIGVIIMLCHVVRTYTCAYQWHVRR